MACSIMSFKKGAFCHNQCKTVHTHGMTSIVQYQQWLQKKNNSTMSTTTNMHCTSSRQTKTMWRHFKTTRFILNLSLTHTYTHTLTHLHTKSWHICLPFVRHWGTKSLRDEHFSFHQYVHKCVNSQKEGSSLGLCCLCKTKGRQKSFWKCLF